MLVVLLKGLLAGIIVGFVTGSIRSWVDRFFLVLLLVAPNPPMASPWRRSSP